MYDRNDKRGGDSNKDSSGFGLEIKALQDQIEKLRQHNDLLYDRINALEEEASRDTLVPVYNRRFFNDELDRQLTNTRCTGNLFLIFVDVDNLKTINDCHGHEYGDQALVRIARILLGQSKSADIIARIGGDEFAILTRLACEAEADKRVADCRQAILHSRIRVGDKEISLSASFGYARIMAGDNRTSLLSRADKAMYESKNAARSQAAGKAG